MRKCITFYLYFKRKYILKFATDGAVLNHNRNAVQATVKIIDVDENWKPHRETTLPEYLQREICVYYFIGIFLQLDLNSMKSNIKLIICWQLVYRRTPTNPTQNPTTPIPRPKTPPPLDPTVPTP